MSIMKSDCEDGVRFEPMNPELDIVEVKEEHHFDEEPSVHTELSSANEEQASNTDLQDAGSTMRRFDECLKEEDIFVKSEFGSCSGSDDSALMDYVDEDGVRFEPMKPELDIVEVKEEHHFDEEPSVHTELSSANEEEASNTDRQDAGLTMRRFDECLKEEDICVKSEFGSCSGSDDSALMDNVDEDGVRFEPMNIVEVKEEHDFDEEPSGHTELSSANEEEASYTDRQDAGLTMRRFDECLKEEDIFVKSEFGSCSGSDDSALMDYVDEDGVRFEPMNIVEVKEEHDFDEEPSGHTELSSANEEEASYTDRQDAGLTMRRFDECLKEEDIFVKSEFGSCSGSDDSALMDYVDEDGVRFEPLNPELEIVIVKEEHDFEEEPSHENELSSANEDGVRFEPLNPELGIVEVKEELDFDEEPSVHTELSSANEEQASNTDRQDAGLTMTRFDECLKEEDIFVKSEFGSCSGSDDSALMDSIDGEKPYACKLCNYKAAQTGHLSAHMITHTGEKRYPCKLCNYKAGCAGHLSVHMRTHTGEKRYPCKLCNYKASCAGHLSVHMRTHTGEKPYACKLCNYKATQRGHLSVHMKSHTGEKPYACKLCNYKTGHPGNLSKHMRTHTGEKRYPCKLCNYKAGCAGHLSAHMRTHTGEKPYLCKLCNYKAAQTGHLSAHMRTHSGEKPYACKLCNFKTGYPGNLSVHMITHTGEKRYPCKLCNYKAAQTGHLSAHMRTHSGEKPYACKLCNYKAAQPGKLSAHMKSHTGEKPYACKLCNYKAAQTGHLSAHMITHTGEKRYQCKLCNYKAGFAGHLSAHMRTHTGEKPYACKLCNYKATQRGHLSRHMKSHTGEKPSKCLLCDYSCNTERGLRMHMSRMHSQSAAVAVPDESAL